MSRKLLGGACLAVVLGLLAGCGGSSVAAGGGQSSGTGGSQSGGTQSGGGGTTTQTVQGIATPSSVSVVTAKN